MAQRVPRPHQQVDRRTIDECRARVADRQERWIRQGTELAQHRLEEVLGGAVVAARARRERGDEQYSRTTSARERRNCTVRRMIRTIVLVHAEAGRARVYLVLLPAGKPGIAPEDGGEEAPEDRLAAA